MLYIIHNIKVCLTFEGIKKNPTDPTYFVGDMTSETQFTNSESNDPGEHCMHNSLICIVPDPPDTAAISRMVTI